MNEILAWILCPILLPLYMLASILWSGILYRLNFLSSAEEGAAPIESGEYQTHGRRKSQHGQAT